MLSTELWYITGVDYSDLQKQKTDRQLLTKGVVHFQATIQHLMDQTPGIEYPLQIGADSVKSVSTKKASSRKPFYLLTQ